MRSHAANWMRCRRITTGDKIVEHSDMLVVSLSALSNITKHWMSIAVGNDDVDMYLKSHHISFSLKWHWYFCLCFPSFNKLHCIIYSKEGRIMMTNICNTIQAVPLIEKWFTRRHDNANKSKKLIQQATLLIKITFASQSQQNLMENSKTYLAASDTCSWDHEDQLVVWQLESTTSDHRLISHFFTRSPKSWENSNETTRTTRWERAIPCGPSREYLQWQEGDDGMEARHMVLCKDHSSYYYCPFHWILTRGLGVPRFNEAFLQLRDWLLHSYTQRSCVIPRATQPINIHR